MSKRLSGRHILLIIPGGIAAYQMLEFIRRARDEGATVTVNGEDGAELLVVDGGLELNGEAFTPQSWLRMPKGDKSEVRAGDEGAKVWIKRNHLRETPKSPAVQD